MSDPAMHNLFMIWHRGFSCYLYKFCMEYRYSES